MTEQPKLSDVTLTMIVRDELMNPAGGLLPMLEYHLPHFPETVVLDTGSVDGTRQLLEHMAGEYPQLKVYDAKFEGYGYARMTANRYVTMPYTFMLDADERLEGINSFVEWWENIKDEEKTLLLGVNFRFKNVHWNGPSKGGTGWNPRLALQAKVNFWNKPLGELSTLMSSPSLSLSDQKIFHFLYRNSSTDFMSLSSDPKVQDWYTHFDHYLHEGTAPSRLPNFFYWKVPNPRSLEIYGINIFSVLARLQQLGLKPQSTIVEELYKLGDSK